MRNIILRNTFGPCAKHQLMIFLPYYITLFILQAIQPFSQELSTLEKYRLVLPGLP